MFQNNETKWQCSLISLSSLDTMMDQEMLLLLRALEQKGVEFTAMLQKLVLYNICILCCFTGQERLQVIDLQSVC